MRRLALIIILCGVVEGKTVTDLVGKQSFISMRSKYEKPCDVLELSTDESRISCEARDGSLVPNGKRCQLIPKTLDRTLWAKCELGKWKSSEAPDTKTYHMARRSKRASTSEDFKDGAEQGAKVGALFGPVGAGVGAVLGGFFCFFFCSSEPEYVVKKAPTYSNCPPSDLQTEYYAEEGKRTAIVSWTPPTPQDEDGSISSNTLISSPENGGSFQGSVYGYYKHTVRYEAKDNDGMGAYCFFDVNVIVQTCTPLPRLVNGYTECDEGNIYGSICTFSCDEGYERIGNPTTKCQQDGQDKSWSGSASCSKVRCPAPDNISNGMVNCLDADYSFQSICSFKCDTGFTLEGSVFIQCQADQTWAVTEQPYCVDAEPPTVECFTPQIFYADRGLLTTSVRWEEPTATDSVDPEPVITQTEGPSPGEVLAEGSSYVKYHATDMSGNTSPECTVELRVQPITCPHPSDTLGDNKLEFNCSDSLYYFGGSCELSCDYNLPLEGVSEITCEKTIEDDVPTGIWEWGSGENPYCREIECPPLDPPINGALAHETVNRRPVVIVLCNENYDIPSIGNFDGQIFCYDSGSWYPLDKTPDCIKPHRPGFLKLPSKLYYYSGQCSDLATQERIKQQFLDILTAEVGPLFNGICPDDIKCTTDAVTVTCGPVSQKRKRRANLNYYNYRHHIEKREVTHATVITFDIVTEWNQVGNTTVEETYDFTANLQAELAQAFAYKVTNGTFNLPGRNLSLRDDSFKFAKFGSISCYPGMRLDGAQCKPCPRGMYLDEKTNICTDCPVGQYMDTDGNTACKMCPNGYSTEKHGSKSPANCTKICSAGSYSKKGLAPCTVCPVGTYQDSEGMTRCVQCPSGQTTALSGSNYPSQCQNFDVLLRDTERDVPLGNISSAESLSFMIWARLFSGKLASPAAMKIIDGIETVLTINISPEISVEIGQQLFETEVLLKETKWFHIVVVWNRDVSSLEVYVNGEKEIEQPISSPSFEFGELYVNSAGSGGVFLTGLQIVERALAETDITAMLSSCTEVLEPSLISAMSFLQSSNIGINIITPSLCDAIDECASLPCGDHQCVNEIGDFRCVCSNGMTGRLCEIFADHCIGNECKNGATCNTHNTDYSCSCPQGYTGPFCETEPVNGGWSDYGEWSVCSQSCDGGERTRNRTCDNPQPGVGGLDCSGSAQETESCNTETCNDCGDEPQQDLGVIPNCTTDTETMMKICKPYCRNGTEMQPKQFSTYRCGPDTFHQWTPLPKFPACKAPVRPDRYVIEAGVDYDTFIPSSAVTDVEIQVTDKLSTVDCSNAARCDVSISLDKGVSRRKRNTGSTLQMMIVIAIGNNGELKLDEYVTDGIVSPALQDVIDAIVSLELTAADIQANASYYFNIESGGVMYTITNSSLTLSGVIDCPDGSVSNDGVCVPCPTSTKAVSNACVYCDVGTYQDETGQTTCKQCPTGYSTPIIGAGDSSECNVVEQTTTVIAPTSQTTGSSVETTYLPEHERHGDNKTGVIAGIAIGSCAVVLAVIALILICYKKHTRTLTRVTNRCGSLSSLSMGRPSSGLSVVRVGNVVIKPGSGKGFKPTGHLPPLHPTKGDLHDSEPSRVTSLTAADGLHMAECNAPLPPISTSYNSPPPPYSP